MCLAIAARKASALETLDPQGQLRVPDQGVAAHAHAVLAAKSTSLSPASNENTPGCGSIASHFISFSGVSELNCARDQFLPVALASRSLMIAVPT